MAWMNPPLVIEREATRGNDAMNVRMVLQLHAKRLPPQRLRSNALATAYSGPRAGGAYL